MTPTVSREAVERFTSGAAVSVDLAGLERDLSALWRQAAEGSAAVTRACMWNLVVVATTDEGRARARSLNDELVVHLPSRTLLLNLLEDDGGPPLEAFVTARCVLVPGTAKRLCSEEITIEARGAHVARVPSLVRALQVPDVPTSVFFADALPAGSSGRELLGEATRVVIDSSRLTPDPGLLEALRGLAQRQPTVDLGWLWLAPLRGALASAFDAPEGGHALSSLRGVTVRHAARAGSSGALLLGWLSSRLASRALDYRLGLDETADLLEVTLALDGSRQVSAGLDRERLWLEAPWWPRQEVATPGAREPRRVATALTSKGMDPLYEAALSETLRLWALTGS